MEFEFEVEEKQEALPPKPATEKPVTQTKVDIGKLKLQLSDEMVGKQNDSRLPSDQ